MSLDRLRDDELAAVVTYLEMRAPAAGTAIPPSPLRLDPRRSCTPEAYRALFRLVGAPWLWFSRLVMRDADLAAILDDPKVELFAVADSDGSDVGMLELDFREAGSCELAFVGLVPSMAGQGHGRWLLAEAIGRAWRKGVNRVHVHSCTLDHPAALSAYRRAGFIPQRRAIERFADPRLAGILPADCAPQVALLGRPRSDTR